LRTFWLSVLLCICPVGAFGQGTDGPQFDADGVLSDLNGNHVAPLAPGVPMLIRGNSLGPRDYCLPSGLDLQRRQAPSPLLPNANMDNGIVYPTWLLAPSQRNRSRNLSSLLSRLQSTAS
jgi:hypothetical protein